MNNPSPISHQTLTALISSIALLSFVGCSSHSPIAETTSPCQGIQGMAVESGSVVATEQVAAGATLSGGAMDTAQASASFCRAQLHLEPVNGSDIRVEVWLPENWNRKLMGYGGAGFDGGLNAGAAPAFSRSVNQGYAVVATDAGHPAGSPVESWVHQQPERVVDFGHRANHLGAVVAKQVIRALYENPLQHAYFSGCSNGGRDGLMAASRYPEDYDAIIAGAPARLYPEILTELIWYTNSVFGPEGAPELESRLELVHQAVLAECDSLDGVKDGILENPLDCDFDPSSLQCTEEASSDCLTAAEVRALHNIYGGPRLSSGETIMDGPMPGSEGAPDFRAWVTTEQGAVFGQEFYRWIVYDDPEWSVEQFDFDRDYGVAKDRLENIFNIVNPDLSEFMANGGKLLMYQGWNDTAIPPTTTIDYYEDVLALHGHGATDHVRLFMIPGMGHCAGGPGANQFDMLPVLERWVEHGDPPDRVVATSPPGEGTPMTHPLCAWPAIAHYSGKGSTHDAENYECRSP